MLRRRTATGWGHAALLEELGKAGSSPEPLCPNERRVMTFREVIESHQEPTDINRHVLLRCIAECLDCSASCTACADADLAEDDVKEMVRCIRLCLDCADSCEATGRIVARQTAPDLRLIRAMVEACSVACLACAAECDRHAAHHEHCRLCAEACRRCKNACDDLLAAMG